MQPDRQRLARLKYQSMERGSATYHIIEFLHLLEHRQSLPLLQDLPVIGRERLHSVPLERIGISAHDIVDLLQTDSTGNETFQGVLAAR